MLSHVCSKPSVLHHGRHKTRQSWGEFNDDSVGTLKDNQTELA